MNAGFLLMMLIAILAGIVTAVIMSNLLGLGSVVAGVTGAIVGTVVVALSSKPQQL